jgi:hypothetical protein
MDIEPVTCSQIVQLTAWARALTTAGLHRADPEQLAAFHSAKADLLARIRNSTPDTPKDTE